MLLLVQNNVAYIGTIIVSIAVVILILFLIRRILLNFIESFETAYAYFTKRPLYIHFHPFIKKLSKNQIDILDQKFTFYNRLDKKYKRYFRHRVACFIKKKEFVARDGFIITEEVEVLVSATAVMLTFGFRDFIIKSIEKIIVYPTQYYSQLSKADHKGEFNAKLKTLVLSWDNFLEGYKIEDDKLNLGIHEFAHAIHFNSISQEDINSVLFIDTYNEIRTLLANNKVLKNKLVTSKYIRSYAYTNHFEFLAVIIETFLETPQAFKKQFPEIYMKVKQMLNFNFLSY